VPTYLDRALADHEVVWAAAGHPAAVFSTTYAELLALTGAREVEVGPEASA
jgi:prolyl-tRNA editing enzyme YbaK/EbsC (Cys-tRNA(Pro) deacylase)